MAKGSGSISKKEFKQFLNIARRSTFENANILIILNRRKILSEKDLNILLGQLDILSGKITNFGKSLNQKLYALCLEAGSQWPIDNQKCKIKRGFWKWGCFLFNTNLCKFIKNKLQI